MDLFCVVVVQEEIDELLDQLLDLSLSLSLPFVLWRRKLMNWGFLPSQFSLFLLLLLLYGFAFSLL